MHPRRHLSGALVLAALLASLAGCEEPVATFQQSQCLPHYVGDRITELAFSSKFETTNLAGWQLIYQVVLVDRDGRSLPSQAEQFRMTDGSIGAARTLFVFESPQSFEDISVSIPTDAITFQQDDLPIIAHIALFLPNGLCLGVSSCPVLTQQLAAAPPGQAILAAAPPAPPDQPQLQPLPLPDVVTPPPQPPQTTTDLTLESYWFLELDERNQPPLLVGPYASAREAVIAAPPGRSHPIVLSNISQVWIVPIVDAESETVSQVVGPFRMLNGAQQAADAMAAQGAGAPIRMTLQDVLARTTQADPRPIVP